MIDYIFWYREISDEILSLFQILVWPLTVVYGLWLFKRIIAYLFLSMESFNFFGAKGKIRPVEEVIEERVMTEIERRKRNSEHKNKLTELESQTKSKEDLLRTARRLLLENDELNRQLNESENNRRGQIEAIKNAMYSSPTADQLQSQISALLAQIAILQAETLKNTDNTKNIV